MQRHLIIGLALAACDGGGPTGGAAGGACADLELSAFLGQVDRVGDDLDANCDGHDGVDADHDGAADLASGGGDCDDRDPAVTPKSDLDLDGVPRCGGDCDDDDPDVGPGFAEECDGIDSDCAGDGDHDDDLGLHACAMQEIFSTSQPVDILFVIDTSCSMQEEQDRAAAAAAALSTPIGDLDYHLGIVTTDMEDANYSGRLVSHSGLRYLDRTTPPAEAATWFSEAVALGTDGAERTRGLDAVDDAVVASVDGYNAGFVRPDASLFVVALSDGDDDSELDAAAFGAWMGAYRTQPAVARFYSLVSPSPVCPGASEPGTVYESVSADSGGRSGSGCEADYAPYFDQLAADIVAISGPEAPVWTLAAPADPATLAVTATTLDGSAIDLGAGDWDYDAVLHMILIPGAWEPGTTFTVDYLRLP